MGRFGFFVDKVKKNPIFVVINIESNTYSL